MRKIALGILIGVVVLAFSGLAAATPNQAAGEIDKVVFIHYPQGNVPYWSPLKAPAPTDQDTTYKYTGIHWSTTPVTWYGADGNTHVTPWPVGYFVNPSGAKDPSDVPIDPTDAVNAAFLTWENEQPSSSVMNFGSQGTTGLSGSVLDGNNVVSWQDIIGDYPNAIAVTVVWYLRGSKVIVDVDTIMNSADPWSVNVGFSGDPDISTGDSSAYDVQDIMTHEAGHWLMLLDLYQWKTQELTMYGYGTKGELQKRTLGRGDELGIDRIY